MSSVLLLSHKSLFRIAGTADIVAFLSGTFLGKLVSPFSAAIINGGQPWS